jgi:Bacterial pre-peptidase C-terminal domain
MTNLAKFISSFLLVLALCAGASAQVALDVDPVNDTQVGQTVLPLPPTMGLVNNAALVAGSGGDVDFYGVSVIAGEILIGMVTPLGASNYSIPDTLVVTRSGTTALTISDDDAGDTLPGSSVENLGSIFRVSVGDTGVISIGVTGNDFPANFEDQDFNGGHTQVGPYSLMVGRISPGAVGGNFTDTDPTNDAFGTTPDAITFGPLGASIAVSALAAGGGDVDFYSLTLSAGTVLTAMTAPVELLATGFHTPDTRLALFDGAGTLLLANDDAGSDPGEEPHLTNPAFTGLGSDNPPTGAVEDVWGSGIRAQITTSGTYYLGVTAFSDADFNGSDDLVGGDHTQEGKYALLVSIPEPGTASLLAIGASLFLVSGRRRS